MRPPRAKKTPVYIPISSPIKVRQKSPVAIVRCLNCTFVSSKLSAGLCTFGVGVWAFCEFKLDLWKNYKPPEEGSPEWIRRKNIELERSVDSWTKVEEKRNASSGYLRGLIEAREMSPYTSNPRDLLAAVEKLKEDPDIAKVCFQIQT